ncbi:tRNA-pseudouridine synthase [Schizosaccharomyces japonicus yFS275]|uniref:tRNA-pseudouridine synthase n=1 Tax=Schizosaccharomyces japonicus (strain yFS275 / FY16936) TaxID=402676 RepID=B6K2Z9_SCHJY|nr:tRNA-pseudouridine synthase [Schizosaccharomyces japonicus yFS275]EEB07856.1 tRNA-pseudouridine synthase [Schizosaccharomyces japonicus yFS275]
MDAARYYGWSKERLISRILELEKIAETSGQNVNQIDTEMREAASVSVADAMLEAPSLKKRKAVRPFMLDKTKFIALRFAYLGWNYNGLAFQTEPTPLPTVEGKLFEALMRAHLIKDPSTCSFSRCGRTDKGVSAMGQVVSLNVRYSEERPIAYCDVLNRLLPEDIRVIAYSPNPPEGFDARFSCVRRHYKYLFLKQYPGGELDIERMSQAAALYLGEHDFRNFCKIDASKQITNYNRGILHSKIICVDPQKQLYAFDLQGTAFLWHQVRCMMAILFLVGQHLEPVDIVSELLNVEKNPCKPVYDMASDLPLVLYDCVFDNIQWEYPQVPENVGPKFAKKLYEQTYANWHKLVLREQLAVFLKEKAETALQVCGTQKDNGTAMNTGDGELRHARKYVPILQRKRQEPVEVVNARYRNKKNLGDQVSA